MTQIYVFTILVLIVLGFVYIEYLKDKFQKAVIGHVYASFYTKTGARKDALCAVDGDAVIPPAGLLSKNPKPTTYFLRHDMTFSYSYPPHYPSFVQATVKTIDFDEGNPEPNHHFKKKPVVSAGLISTFRNEGTGALMMRAMRESLMTEDILNTLQTAGGNKTLLYVCIGIMAIVGILGFFVFQLSGQVGNLLSLYGL